MVHSTRTLVRATHALWVFLVLAAIVPNLSTAQAPSDPQARKMLTALSSGDVATVREMVKAGFRLDQSLIAGLKPIHVALVHGYRSIVEYLVSKGADAEAKMPPIRQVLDAGE
ncbi:MAG: hypothetical protein AAF517_18270, partial [Planctomycetota bacterium]